MQEEPVEEEEEDDDEEEEDDEPAKVSRIFKPWCSLLYTLLLDTSRTMTTA